MYLKKIEIQGFKSFANKTLFEFDGGVTVIVGPNGSGKSNVSDAVRWVLGEQSARQLRGGNMQDVIFAGTQTRKPQGFAFVALTLDNADHALPVDFDEVVVSRRLYRSGESEYRLNGSICRLKDVNELFYDTGIGKDGYSVIGQGQIDKILSSKPEDRRELFDEAVGITKFKRSKAAAVKKLENEHQNLVRINDILSELERQVGPLSEQSENAKKYLALRETLKKKDINLFLREAVRLEAELKSIDADAAILNDDLAEANAASEKLKTEYDELASLVSAMSAKLGELWQQNAEAEKESASLHSENRVLEEKINSAKLSGQHVRERLDTLEKERESKKGALSGLERKVEELTATGRDAADKIGVTEQELNAKDEEIAGLENALEEANRDLIDSISERSEINASGQKLSAQLEHLCIRGSETAQKILKIQSDYSELEERLSEKEKECRNAQEEIAACERRQEELEAQAADLMTGQQKISDQLDETKAILGTAAARLETLKNIAERYEGYGSAVRKVMEYGSSSGGVHGVVADLIATDRKYELAIETALGGRIQNVVTDTEETAAGLIEYLKREKLGRATFLPLSAVRKKDTSAGQANFTGILGTAAQLVRTKDTYRDLIDQLLGNVLVADTMDHAIRVQKTTGYRNTVVTLEGELLSSSGSISGGAYKNSSNLLGRKREIEELTGQAEKYRKKVRELEEELSDVLERIRSKRADIEDVKDDRQAAMVAFSSAKATADSLKTRLSEYIGSSDDMDKEHADIEAQIEELRSLISANKAELSALDVRREKLDDTIADMAEKIDEGRRMREALAGKLSGMQVDAAGLMQQADDTAENMERIREEIEALDREKAELSEKSGREDIDIAGMNDRIAENNAAIRDIAERKISLEAETKELTQKKEEGEAQQKLFFDRKDEISLRITALEKDTMRLGSRREKSESRLDDRVAFIWNEYEVSRQDAVCYIDEELKDISDAALKKQVDAVSSEIKALGTVNVNAIEEYREVSERYTLMKTQHDDIVAAEENLTGIITELDAGMRKLFAENFKAIQAEFAEVFSELFGGGTGKLELDEEGDVLEAGIHIIAQPPGKKLQNMMQLSGGEKALTAIALLFSIQNLHPSPFALLDEIEAALDDSNVDRFAGYLKKLSDNTQFIVITHRKGTMNAADRLYGITMQERGVSVMVSVKLIESELDR